jgi:hypothetical protein
LAALRGAIGRFRAISGTARRCISRYRASCDNQTTKGGQKQNFLHHGSTFLSESAFSLARNIRKPPRQIAALHRCRSHSMMNFS